MTDYRRNFLAGDSFFLSRAAAGERGIWQPRYWEHTICDDNDFARHVDYIHINPVKHRLVARARDWPYSSFHRMVKPVGWVSQELNPSYALPLSP